MADHGDDVDHGDDEVHDETPGYRPPAPKSMEEILKSDADDESLRKYKESLLGAGNTVGLEICEYCGLVSIFLHISVHHLCGLVTKSKAFTHSSYRSYYKHHMKV